ncbi:magnesium chelatase subunit D [Methylobacterium haplocladii]|uniref:Mg-protoporphyrin IX chelatase n=1 Tax=Methylobacterium haplocladii TaxID=1176176 RepID=A0A512IQV2_9HYPH|nr:magnesium chelatase subunit D [Methylobacterium haplocladii]GEP00080.1 Mg-protoporphyrin IX chelatase [Methylobacterium haplocladii]
MSDPSPHWTDALRVAALIATDPQACGGVLLRAGAGPVRDLWLTLLQAGLPPNTPIRRMPTSIADDRLLGGLDLAATLRAGRPVAQSGLLAEADGGIVVVPMAERLSAGTVARLCAALDSGSVSLERDGLCGVQPARFGLILLDEGGEDEAVAEALADRLAFRVDLNALGLRDIDGQTVPPMPRRRDRSAETAASLPPPRPEMPKRSEGLQGGLQRARSDLVSSLQAADAAPRDEGGAGIDPIATLCAAAADLGIASLRGPLLAARVARLAAWLDHRADLTEADVIEAARLVLAPRATRLPASEPPEEAPDERAEPEEAPPPDTGDPSAPPDDSDTEGETTRQDLDEIVLEAARAAIPPNLLAQLLATGPRLRDGKAGRMGIAASAPRSGRPAGSRPGDPRRGRLDLIATLRAAAPWQRIRRGERVGETTAPATRRIIVLPDDLRIKKLRQRTEATTIFCVDASGSAALERLAETKGAVELLLAESYVRRDRVALVAFRGAGAEVILPPTRSLARAKRVLGGLPGGGGTPLAAGIDAAATLALAVRRAGGSPVIVLLTDGRANVARSGEGGRARAGEEALAAGRLLKALGLRILLIDTGTRPDGARRLADVADARYIPLPYADASGVSAAVRAAIA